MSNPTISIPRSQKRWPILTIFLVFLVSKKMHTLFVPPSYRHPFNSRFICGNSWRIIIPPSFSSSYRIRHPYHTTFVTVFIPLSFCQIFSIAYQSTNSKISQFSQLSTNSTNSRLSQLSTPSRPSLPSLLIHGSIRDNSWRHPKAAIF